MRECKGVIFNGERMDYDRKPFKTRKQAEKVMEETRESYRLDSNDSYVAHNGHTWFYEIQGKDSTGYVIVESYTPKR